MNETIKSLKDVKGIILVSALTCYKTELQRYQKFGEWVNGYLIQRDNLEFQMFSQPSVYQYKVLQRLIGCRDLMSVNRLSNYDFHIGMGNFFYKTLPELALGNLLFLSQIKFDFLEFYDGVVGHPPLKTSTFVLKDLNICVDVYADTSGLNDRIFVEIRYQEINPFNFSKNCIYKCHPFKLFFLKDYIKTLLFNLSHHDVQLNPKALDLVSLLPDFTNQELLSGPALYTSKLEEPEPF
jgi:hypothetical protein